MVIKLSKDWLSNNCKEIKISKELSAKKALFLVLPLPGKIKPNRYASIIPENSNHKPEVLV
jgi:hypothetical protein